MEKVDVTSTQLTNDLSNKPPAHLHSTNKLSSNSSSSGHASPSQISPEENLSNLNQYAASMPNLGAGTTMPNPLSAVDPGLAPFTNSFNPLTLLQASNPSLPSCYSGFDSLSMMSMLQAASLGLPGTVEMPQYLTNSNWLNSFNSRKRRHAKPTAPSELVDVKPPDLEKKALKHTQSQPTSTSASSVEKKDDSYWDRRRKNNEAAKRSRDARRLKEDEVLKRAKFLEQENTALKAQMKMLRAEFSRLQFFIYSQAASGPGALHPQPASSLHPSLLLNNSFESDAASVES